MRTKKAQEVFKMSDGGFHDRSGQKLSKEQIVKNQTDDGRLLDVQWDSRHHVSPSYFNDKNKSYFQVS